MSDRTTGLATASTSARESLSAVTASEWLGLTPNHRLCGALELGARTALDLEGFNRALDQLGAVAAGVNDRVFDDALELLGVDYEVAVGSLAEIPDEGAVVVVANHPFGGLDGVILGALVSRVRKDVKILGNHLLSRVERLQPYLLPVDPRDGPEAVRSNTRSLRAALEWLGQGGAVALFPSGAASRWRPIHGRSEDPEWKSHAVRLAVRANARVTPVFFAAQGSIAYRAAGLMHPAMQRVLGVREALHHHGVRVRVRIGPPIQPKTLRGFSGNEARTDYLRFCTHVLEHRREPGETESTSSRLPEDGFEPVIDPVAPELLKAEIAQLESSRKLIEQGAFRVYCAEAGAIPHVLREIGRLREVTFRANSEGTGRSLDLVACDHYYRHLFLWDERAGAVVGSYRLGLTDEILPVHGKEGLFSSKLFDYGEKMLRRLDPGIEMGRAFIRREYQRKPTSLALLWRGVGEFIAANPRYTRLFGPVSINREYSSLSKDLIVQFLKENRVDAELAAHVHARHPPARTPFRGRERRTIRSRLRDIEAVSALISGFEDDGKGVPVLLRQYLRLNGTIVCFNVDDTFGGVLDGLIVVDLATIDDRHLSRYLGADGFRRFFAWHAEHGDPDAELTRRARELVGVGADSEHAA